MYTCTCTLDAYEIIYVHQKLITWLIMIVQGAIKIKVHVHVYIVHVHVHAKIRSG